MSNLANKFKTRKPEDTIKIIQDFFTSRGLEYKVVISSPTEAGTWFSHIRLIYNGQIILTSNGKGMTETFSLASGFAELYERFSNKINCTFSPVIMGKYMEISKQELGFELAPNEKPMTYEEMYNKPLVKLYFDSYLKNESLIKTYFDLVTNGRIIGVPCYNLCNPTQFEYYDPRILTHVMGSTGMCAGNSLEEALNQGLSEVFELYCSHKFFNKQLDTYYIIDETTITNPTLLDCLAKIRAAGFNIRIIDLSYNYGMPVLASVLVNPRACNVHVNCGAFPVFDIALERIITELYQGIKQYDEQTIPQTPWRSQGSSFYMINHLNSKTQATFLPEEVFTNYKIVPYNNDVFLSNPDASNEEINEYFRKLCTKLNFNMLYMDVSTSPDVTALQIFYDTYDCQTEKYEIFKYTAKDIKEAWFDDTVRLYAINAFTLQGKDHDAYEAFNKFSENYFIYPPHGSFSGNLMGSDWNNPYPSLLGGDFEIFKIMDFFVNLDDPNYQARGFDEMDAISIRLRFYQMLKTYLNCGEYSKEEIKVIFNNMGIICTDEDFEILKDREKLFIEIFCKNFREIYFNEDYDKLIHCYLPYFKKV